MKSAEGHTENANSERNNSWNKHQRATESDDAPVHMPAKPKIHIRAIDCLLKMRALQEEVLKNKNITLDKCEHSSMPRSVATIAPALAALAVKSQTSPPEVSTSASVSPPARTMKQSRGKVKKCPSNESPKESLKKLQRKNPKRTLMTEVPLVVKPPTLQPAPARIPPPKAQEFVSSSKASELYVKYSQVRLEIDGKNATGRTANNTVSDYIDVKLNINGKKQ